jgi:hypothetical protein
MLSRSVRMVFITYSSEGQPWQRPRVQRRLGNL